MHPTQHAKTAPDRPAFVMFDSGQKMTYAELDADSNRAAQMFRKIGMLTGDGVAVLLKNRLEYPVIYWGAQRSGLITTPISTHLKFEEIAYILKDCDAKVLVTSLEDSPAIGELMSRREELGDLEIFTVGQRAAGARDWRSALDEMPATPIPDEVAGYYQVYSSGSTGRPKGVVQPYAPGPVDGLTDLEARAVANAPRYDGAPVILIPAPLYHAAPLLAFITNHRLGATVVVLEKFDAEQALRAIETWKVNDVQMVPTMFVRLLALPDEVRLSYDLSSLQRLAHSAAPCPVSVKRRMIEWLGPIIYEIYGGSEAIGRATITSEEWLKKPGSVGKATYGVLHICDEAGAELPTGQPGLIYFEGVAKFSYRNDEDKTAKSRHPQHATWATMGDIGYMDEDGYLFLSDRKDFTIISGGVNIYPQATEDLLIGHHKVFDAAVIGVPSEAFGEEVKAIVQPRDWSEAGPALEAELIAFCEAQISKLACPRSVDFVQELPRLPTGKLAKHELRRPYWPSTGRFIAGDQA